MVSAVTVAVRDGETDASLVGYATNLLPIRCRVTGGMRGVEAIHAIRRQLLAAFERNDLSGWPRGLYARAWVRAYANVVGLDPSPTVDEFCRLFPQGDRRVGGTIQEMGAIAESVEAEQRRRHLSMPTGISTGFMPAVFRWASGDNDWAAIVEESFGGHEGDLIRALRRLIDVLRQLGESPEVPAEQAALLGKAARVIDRGIVLESALI